MIHRICLAGLAFAIQAGCAEIKGIKADGHLDMVFLRAAYFDNDFRTVQASLERFLKNQPKEPGRDEKIFAYSYLGVLCAADASAKGTMKAEAHFKALLQISPQIGLVDLFTPIKTLDLFERLARDYYENLKNEKPPLEIAAMPAPAGENTQAVPPGERDTPSLNAQLHAPRAKSDKNAPRWVWWALGSAAVFAAGASIYTLVATEPPDPTRHAFLDGSLQ